jgi:hypothetical protein
MRCRKCGQRFVMLSKGHVASKKEREAVMHEQAGTSPEP